MFQWRSVYDTLQNFITGLGTAKDPTTQSVYNYQELNRNELESAYRSDWIARAVVDSPAEDMTREWRNWQASPEQIEAIEDVEKAHQLQRKTKMAIIRARLYGGGALVIGVDDGALTSDPINFDKVKKNTLKFVVVLNRYELNAGPRIYNVDSPWYTRPSYYRVSTPLFGFDYEAGSTWPDNPKGNTRKDPRGDVALQMTPNYGMVDIHPSRVIEFSGNELPDWRLAPMGGGWGDSVLQTVDEALKDWGLIQGGIAAMVNDAKMDVVKIPELSQRISTAQYQQALFARFQFANMSKSMINTLMLDSQEEWDRVQTNFGGLPNLIREFMTIISGAARIPMSRLMGQASGRGLAAEGSSGGEQDMRNYYDSTMSYQETDLRPRMEPLDRVLQLSALGKEDPSVHYIWAPLYTPDPKDVANVAFLKAQAFQIDVNAGLFNENVLREARANQLIEDSTYPGLEDAIDEYGLEPEEPEVPPGGWMPGQVDPATGKPIPAPPGFAGGGGVLPGKGGGGQPPKGLPGPPQKPKPEKTTVKVGGGNVQITHQGREDVDNVHNPRQGDTPSQRKIKKDWLRDATPQPLYVRRDVLNGADIVRWAKGQGFKTTLPADDMHVTVCYSRTPVDWMKAGDDDYGSPGDDVAMTIAPGGPRMVERFGDAVVLLFASSRLRWRHDSFKDNGASWDHNEYQPHITITWNDPPDSDLSSIEPYRGEIKLGPEIFEPIDENFRDKIVEDYSPDQPRDPDGKWTSGGGGEAEHEGEVEHEGSGEHFDVGKFKDLMTRLLRDQTGVSDIGAIAHHSIHAAPHLATMIGHEIGMHAVKDAVKEALLEGLSAAVGGAVAGPVGAMVVGAAASLMVHGVAHKLGITHENAHHALTQVVHHLSTHYHQIMHGETFMHLVGRTGGALVHGIDAKPGGMDARLQKTLIAVGKALQKMRFDKTGSLINDSLIRDYNKEHDEKGRFTFAGGGSGGGEAGRSGGAGGTDRVAEAHHAAEKAAGAARPLSGLPQKPIELSDGRVYVPGPIEKIRNVAADYMKKAGLPYSPPTDYKQVDPVRATRIADEFEHMPHAPDDPEVKASYKAMADETLAQWQAIKQTGLKVDWVKPGMEYPYKSPREAAIDVRDNNHWWGFPTESGFGSGTEAAQAAMRNNPLLADSGETIGGHRAVVNDVFRIVHDYFGHFKEGVGFRASGEENAWRSHAAMYSPKARGAMTSETRGQNSWVNYGPFGEKNRTASETETHYAPQKIGVMPEWTREEGK